MLISCPSCDKDYRVPSSAIPPEGREVRCSACGAVWFEAGQRTQMLAAAAASADVLPYPVIETRYTATPRRESAPPPGGARAQQAALAVVYPAPETESQAGSPRTDALAVRAKAWIAAVTTMLHRAASRLGEQAVLAGSKKDAPRPSPAQAATAAARGRLRVSVANRLTPMRALGWALWLGAVCGTAYLLTAQREAVTAHFPPAAKLYDRLPGAIPEPGLSVRAELSRYAQSLRGPAVVVTGSVFNDGEEAVPRVLLTAHAAGRAETQVLPLPGVALPRGGERPFAVRALLPEGTQAVTVRVERGEPAAKTIPASQAGPMGFAGPPPVRGTGQ